MKISGPLVSLWWTYLELNYFGPIPTQVAPCIVSEQDLLWFWEVHFYFVSDGSKDRANLLLILRYLPIINQKMLASNTLTIQQISEQVVLVIKVFT